MTTHPPCKINLGLRVLGRRADGYHELQTVFHPVYSLHDELTISPLPAEAADTTLSVGGIPIDAEPEANLCMKAYRLLQVDYGLPPVAISLHKGIPYGAGLGGGSSDAAYTLTMLNSLFGLGLGQARLEAYAAHLGADCAFFIGCHTAYATGIGERLEPLSLDLGDYDIRIAIPEGEHVSTREAYGGLDAHRAEAEAEAREVVDLREALQRPVEEWRTCVGNDFEVSVFAAHPAIAALKASFYAQGAAYASMTGSGAAVYGLFRK